MPLCLAMIVAMPTWCGRISPVLGVARRMVVAEVEEGAEVGREALRIGACRPPSLRGPHVDGRKER